MRGTGQLPGTSTASRSAGSARGRLPAKPSAGDVGHGADVALADQGEHGRGVDERRPQQLVGQGVAGAGPGLVVQAPARPAQQGGPDQGITVAAQTPGMDAHQDVAPGGRGCAPQAEQAVLFDDADRKAGQVHLARR